MYRYLAFVWNCRDARQAAAARLLANRLQTSTTQWNCRVERRGLLAFNAGTRPGSSEAHLLAGGRGAIFGAVFARSDAAPGHARSRLDAREREDIATFGARHVLERFWGRYVAIAEDGAAASVWILRDPSGSLPCLLAKVHGVHVFFSDLEDCLTLQALDLTVNWDYVAAAVANSALQVRETGFNEVTEILPGECVELQGGDTLRRSLLWNPLEIARRDAIESVDEATSELHRTTHACVRAWRSCYDGILHSLSGGLDSSIVLSCLVKGPRRPVVTCLNYYATGADEDERRYARLATDRAGVALIERLLRAEDVDLRGILQIRRSARPTSSVAALQRQRLESQLAHEIGAGAIFSGAGGDSVYYQGRADLAVADVVRRHGPGPRMWRAALDAARITRLSVWPLIRRAVRAAALRSEWRPHDDAVPERTLVSRQALESRRDNRWRHPWFEQTAGVAHGTLWHALSLSTPTNFYESFERPDDPERTYPLLSQPLVELCLRIPTYVLIAGGWDRAIARRAFADEVPLEIIRRRSKGSINELSTRLLDGNIEFVREILLDGLLVREGILDGARLEACLSGRRSPTDFEYNEILHEHLSMEAWLRRGTELRTRAAA